MNKTLSCRRSAHQRNKTSPRTSKWAREDDEDYLPEDGEDYEN
jgi:hypothetical protein